MKRSIHWIPAIVAIAATLLVGVPAGATDDPVVGVPELAVGDSPTPLAPRSGDVVPVPGHTDALADAAAAIFSELSAPVAPQAEGGIAAAAVTTHVVTTELDVVNGADGVLSLREAVTAANSDGADSRIELTTGVEYELTICGPDPAQEDLNVDGDLDHTDVNALTIDGGIGLDIFSGTPPFAVIHTSCTERLIQSFSTDQLTIEGVVLSDGSTPTAGGGILAAGPVAMVGSGVTSNDATGATSIGAGVATSGSISAHNSFVVGNDATLGGSGFYAVGDIELVNSMVAANTGGAAAALAAGGNVTMTFSTVAANTTTGVGAADVVSGGNLTTTGSFLGASAGAASLVCNVGGASSSGGYNFVTDLSCGLGGATDTESLVLDPGFDGASFIFPKPGSLLHNAVPPASCSGTDDVFLTSRPQGERCEIGAVERRLAEVPKLTAATDAVTPVVFADVLAELDDVFGAADETSLRIRTAPTYGTAVLDGTELTFDPAGEASGVEAFELEICDTAGVDCSVIDVEVTVDPLTSRWFFTNVLQGGVASAEINFGKGAGEQFFVGDFDGNGIDDLAKRTNGTNLFEILNLNGVASAANQTIGYGKPGDEVFVGDFDGNGTDTFAVRRGNQFFVKNSVTPGPADVVIGYGKAGDEVFVGDWDRDGDDTFAVRRGNVFYARNSVTTGNADEVFGYGKAADRVLVGDWDANGSDTFAVRRGNVIFVRNDFLTAPAEFSFGFGKAADELFPGDWNNDNLDTFAVRRIIN